MPKNEIDHCFTCLDRLATILTDAMQALVRRRTLLVRLTPFLQLSHDHKQALADQGWVEAFGGEFQMVIKAPAPLVRLGDST